MLTSLASKTEIMDITEGAKWATALMGKYISFLIESPATIKCVTLMRKCIRAGKEEINRLSRENTVNIS